ncbi:hypothetical protein [Denitrobaculum tricleocarpae]|uniref:Uncharacterized protein n=1 Tax=Denitrobaculum tricleocarpae TaxID=2591009 RepID=A0A545TU23_9PROT|nr:hypothetical protein [Denitrobaculum tricleocarpae]TQV80713.1 hypothetical protein FKG95_11185 [Denitrobaculum tricleocarpae]
MCENKSYEELKADMEAIQQQMVDAKKAERTNALKEVKRLCKDSGFTAGMHNLCKLKAVIIESFLSASDKKESCV